MRKRVLHEEVRGILEYLKHDDLDHLKQQLLNEQYRENNHIVHTNEKYKSHKIPSFQYQKREYNNYGGIVHDEDDDTIIELLQHHLQSNNDDIGIQNLHLHLL